MLNNYRLEQNSATLQFHIIKLKGGPCEPCDIGRILTNSTGKEYIFLGIRYYEFLLEDIAAIKYFMELITDQKNKTHVRS